MQVMKTSVKMFDCFHYKSLKIASDPHQVLLYNFSYCLSVFRYISILPVIPVTVHLSPQEAIETRHPQDTRHSPPPIPKVSADLQTDLTLYKLVQTHTYTSLPLKYLTGFPM